MSQEQSKKYAANTALEYIEDNSIVGVGTGSTIAHFIPALAEIKHRIEGAVASSPATETLLKEHNIPVFNHNTVSPLSIYIDSTDEATRFKHLIKGGGGALTGEKILAEASQKFICILDHSKLVDRLGKFPLPVEVMPMAQSQVARALVKLGGSPLLRENFKTDHGNIILDVHNLSINEPTALEQEINQIVGVVSNGLFAKRSADLLIVANNDKIETI